MDFLWDKITEWLKEMLIGGIVSNLSGMFDATNQKVAEISGQVGLSPQAWNGSIFSMIQNLSETVIVPIAGAILAFVMTLELIQLITDKNNLNDMDTWIFFKWAFKSAAAVLIVTNTWTIVMGVFDAAQSVVASASGLIIGDTSINISSVMVGIEDRLMEMELGPLFGLWFQSLFVGIMSEEQLGMYATYMATLGNRPDLFPGSGYIGKYVEGSYTDYAIPPEALDDEVFAAIIKEAEKYLGYPYVWGGSSPSTSFDCSGFVSWVINHSGWDVGRLGAQGLCNICTPVSSANVKPGDLVFFTGTYDTPGVSHVGIYVGNNMMIHCGDPISYANLNSSYWQSHFYRYGRLP